jgi:hypothetical protein
MGPKSTAPAKVHVLRRIKGAPFVGPPRLSRRESVIFATHGQDIITKTFRPIVDVLSRELEPHISRAEINAILVKVIEDPAIARGERRKRKGTNGYRLFYSETRTHTIAEHKEAGTAVTEQGVMRRVNALWAGMDNVARVPYCERAGVINAAVLDDTELSD